MKQCIAILLIIACTSCERHEVEERFRFNGSYAVIGDSISYGKGSADGTSWCDILRDTLGVVYYKNYAVCGSVASSRYPDTQYTIKAQIESIESHFDLITVMIGINDCLMGKELPDVDDVLSLPMEKVDYRKSFTHGFVYDMCLLKSKFPDSQIIVIAPPSIEYDTKYPLDAYISVERLVSQRLDLPFIDVSDSEYSPRGDLICSDRIHPTDRGYELLAVFIYKRMKEGILAPL